MSTDADSLIPTILSAARVADKSFIETHVESLPARYFTDFSPNEIARHADELSRLSNPSDFVVLWETSTQSVSLTVLAYDYPAEFSVLTGLLAASRFDILSGSVYTYHRRSSDSGDLSGPARRRLRRGWYLREADTATAPTRRIIDSFAGRIPDDQDAESWIATFEEKLRTFLALLAKNDADALSEAKRRLTEEVTEALAREPLAAEQVLYPVDLSVSADEEFTKLKIVSQDTPFFLYSLSNALAVHNVSVEHVEIRTIGSRVEDEFFLTDSEGNPIKRRKTLTQLKLSALVTKQFTYFLGRAPDPQAALLRFEQMLQDLFDVSGEQELTSLLEKPDALQDLARLLGASDFLWEDFIRLQYESILPMVAESQIESLAPEAVGPALERELERGTTVDERIAILNRFKDHHTYLIDLDHILNPEADFFFLSSRLSAMAEAVVGAAIKIRFDELTERYGVPRTVAGIQVPFAVLGLGKLGGAALGYASDLELMFVYSDSGKTDGQEKITNAEFFDRLFQAAATSIESKREGIYQVDLRLRPHGSAGSFATSLGTFVRYYSTEAMSFEKLALVRLRAIAGDRDFGAQVERIRDQLVYQADSIDLAELRQLRQRQLEEKAGNRRLNAKFSPGGLVDLEYSVQILQIFHGRTNPSLRTPRIHHALDALVEAGTVDRDEANRIVRAYRFSRRLINGLRMLRGNAKDLFLPEIASPEYLHLARRMGYRHRGGLTPAEQLHLEFETTSASVRTFVERHLGRDALPGEPVGTVADLVLTVDAPEDLVERVCDAGGLRDCARAQANIERLVQAARRNSDVAELLILAWDVLRDTADPDMALNNWERLVATLDDPAVHFDQLVAQPKRVEILLRIMAGSQFLAESLIKNPDFFDRVVNPELVAEVRSQAEYYDEVRGYTSRALQVGAGNQDEYLDALRRYRTREILRIGARDIALYRPMPEVLKELSNLAGALVSHALDRAYEIVEEATPSDSSRFCILAFGKLGGSELNYSSDIDLLAVYRVDAAVSHDRDIRVFSKVLEAVRGILSNRTAAGYVYRVDLRLRPYGSSGPLVTSVEAARKYYETSAGLWEHQALLKLSPVAGNTELGDSFVASLQSTIARRRSGSEIRASIEDLRNQAIALADSSRLGSSEQDVKTGVGGIRDIEFLVQGLQLAHGHEKPEVLSPNTLEAVAKLREAGFLERSASVELVNDYVYLRRVEHLLQIFDDRQVHRLPSDPAGLDALARRSLGPSADGPDLLKRLDEVRTRVRGHYDALLPR
jgi:glutamate-ammonia-ligase adenylyltransferase